MNSIRVRFYRGENVKFISHLDLMKVFERTIRRTGLPIAYSQGFNPHPQMVFGLPLSVGVSSEAEYADFDLTVSMEPAEFMDKMNKELPNGLVITAAAEKLNKGNIMASVSGAVYDISVFLKESFTINQMTELLEGFLKSNIILVKKEGKAGIRDIDIRPMIFKLEVSVLEDIPKGYEMFDAALSIKAFLAAGSVSNLKPELLISALAEKTGIQIGAVRIHRKELFVNKDGIMTNPLKD